MKLAYERVKVVFTNTDWLHVLMPPDVDDTTDLELLVAAAVHADRVEALGAREFRFGGGRITSFATEPHGFAESMRATVEARRPIVVGTTDPMIARLVLSFPPGNCHMVPIREALGPYGLWGFKLLTEAPFNSMVVELCVPGLVVEAASLTVAELTHAVRDVISFGTEWGPVELDK
jgi:hypothetical protein